LRRWRRHEITQEVRSRAKSRITVVFLQYKIQSGAIHPIGCDGGTANTRKLNRMTGCRLLSARTDIASNTRNLIIERCRCRRRIPTWPSTALWPPVRTIEGTRPLLNCKLLIRSLGYVHDVTHHHRRIEVPNKYKFFRSTLRRPRPKPGRLYVTVGAPVRVACDEAGSRVRNLIWSATDQNGLFASNCHRELIRSAWRGAGTPQRTSWATGTARSSRARTTETARRRRTLRTCHC
jgi:hypothetical protein